MQITTYTPDQTVIETLSFENATSPAECIERVREASATTTDIKNFLRALGHAIDFRDMKVVKYALARALYRENRDLTLEQVALVAETTTERVLHHLRYLGISFSHRVSADDATRVMMRIAD